MLYFIKLIFKNIYRFVFNKKYRTFYWLVFKLGDKPRYKEDNIFVENLNLKIADSMSFIWQFNEIFVEEFYKFISNKKSPVIFDCGANIGLSVLYFKRLYPESRIIAIEADPKIFSMLHENLQKNGVSDIVIINKALWENDKGVELISDGADGASIFLKGNSLKVPSISLSELLIGEDEIDMLKMDIEGAEIKVLSACHDKDLAKIKNIFIEFHSYKGQEQELATLFSLLERNNFRYYILSPSVRPMPLVYKFEKNNKAMDLQLNIFAYKMEHE